MDLFSGISRRQKMIVQDACRSGAEALVDPTRMNEGGISARLTHMKRWPRRQVELQLNQVPDSYSLTPGDKVSVGFQYGSASYRFVSEVLQRHGRTLVLRCPQELQPTWSQRRPRVGVPENWEVFCDIRGLVPWLKPHVAAHIDEEDTATAKHDHSSSLTCPVIELSDSGLSILIAGVRRSFSPIVGNAAQDSLLRVQTTAHDSLQIPCSLSVRSVLIEERRAYDDDDLAPARMVRTARLGLQFDKIAQHDRERIAQFIALEAERQSGN